MSSESQKFDADGEEYTPRHSQRKTVTEKTPVERQLDGIAGQLRTLTAKVSDQARAHDVEVNAIIAERKAEIAPVVAAARTTRTEMHKVIEEFSGTVATICRMDLGALRRALPMNRWKYADAVVREAEALRDMFRLVPATLDTYLNRADRLSLSECGSGIWRATREEIVETLTWQTAVPADVRKRMAILQDNFTALDKMMADAAANPSDEKLVEINREITRPSAEQDAGPENQPFASEDFDPRAEFKPNQTDARSN